MRKRDKIKNLTPFIFVMMWLSIFDKLNIAATEDTLVLVVGSLIVLVLGSIIVTDYMFELFDKNDNEEEDDV